jgi:hypothetical protein
MKDFNNQQLEVGDNVACLLSGYRNLIIGIVLRFTPQKIVVEIYNPVLKDKQIVYYTSDQVAKYQKK